MTTLIPFLFFLAGGCGSTVYSVAFSPKGRVLAVGHQTQLSGRAITLWDVETGRLLASDSGTPNMMHLAFSPDGSRLYSTRSNRFTPEEADGVMVRDACSLREIKEIGHVDGPVVPCHGGARVAAALASSPTINVWDVDSGELMQILNGHHGRILSLSCSADGRILASGSDDRTVRIWDLEDGVEKHSLKGHFGGVWSVTLTPDGKLAASCSSMPTRPDAGEIVLWDTSTGREHKRLLGHKDWVRAVVFDPSGTYLASGGLDRNVILWDVAQGTPLWTRSCLHELRCVVFSPDGRLLATGGGTDGVVTIWDVKLGTVIRQLPE